MMVNYGGPRESHSKTDDEQTTGQDSWTDCCCCKKGYKWFVQVLVLLAVIYLIISIVYINIGTYLLIVSASIILACFFAIGIILACCSNICLSCKCKRRWWSL